MRSSSMKQGFMEPTGHGLYYENRYLSSRKDEENDLEAQKYDSCENSSDDSTEELQVGHTAKEPFRHTSSYGSIKRPKYRQPSYKIAPTRNAKHSVAITTKEAGAVQETNGDPEDQARRTTTDAFAQEKTQQRNLSSFERFESIRKQRIAMREKRQAACDKARKVRRRAMKDVAAAQDCLVDTPPTANVYVLAKRTEVPAVVDFVEVPSSNSGRRGEARPNKLQAAKRNWKGEKMDLNPGGAYVVIN